MDSFRWQWPKKGYESIEAYENDLLKTEFEIIKEDKNEKNSNS